MYLIYVMSKKTMLDQLFSIQQRDYLVPVIRHYIAEAHNLIVLTHLIQKVLGEWSECLD